MPFRPAFAALSSALVAAVCALTAAPAAQALPPAAASANAAALAPGATTATTTDTLAVLGAARGALPPGAAAYAVPTGALHVATTGSNLNPGTATRPLRTIQRAVDLAPAGGTVVVHSGVYRESVVTPARAVTIQNAPKAVVWLDSSVAISTWRKDGSQWRADGWTYRFDSSPTYTKGAPDNTEPGWRFLDPRYPMAAHPDMVFVGTSPQRQVASRAQVVPGTFFLDTATSRLYLGTDPTGKAVRGSTFAQALVVRGAGSVVRGIGVRRYSPSVWHAGGVVLRAPRITLQNVLVEDLATSGVSVQGTGALLDRVTIRRSGMLGLHGRFADGLRVRSSLVTQNNWERFNPAPNAGGAKLGATRGVSVVGSSFSSNYGHGFWIDMSVYNTTLARSVFDNNRATGIFLEISAKALVVGNVVRGNGEEGIKVNNTSQVRIWNNTVVGKGRPLGIYQDGRRNTDRYDQAVDPRQAFPDPTMPWTLGPVEVRNNVLTQVGTASSCILCVEDYSFTTTAEQMGVTVHHNLFQRATSTSPTWLVVWARGTVKNPYVFTTLAQAASVTGQHSASRELVGTAALTSGGALTTTARGYVPAIAAALPSDVAAAAARTAGTRWVGAW